jgi:SAM-dependent methyltransferase
LGSPGTAEPPIAAPPPRTAVLRLVLLSALILFLEMLLVRWVGTELRIFAYLQNGVLVATFLGLGLGCWRSREPAALLPAAAALALVALAVTDPFGWAVGETLTQGLASLQDSVVWSTRIEVMPHVRTALVFFAVVVTFALLWALCVVFVPLGQWLGRWMEADRPIRAYTANIAGSLLGIAAFVALTAAGTPPVVWLLPAAAGLLALPRDPRQPRRDRLFAAVLVVAVPLLAWAGRPGRTTLWSPYQKLSIGPLYRTGAEGQPADQCGETLTVNSTYYQTMLDFDPARRAARPDLYPPQEIPRSQYVLPFRLAGPRGRVLVVGSGAGNDVAGALAAGAWAVDAVEIDPMIARLGREHHPSKPYAAPAVHLFVTDARAYFRSASGPYDLIWFGLLDSHTTPSAYANVRLDHFVYTRESLAEARRLLAPSGVVTLLFEAETPWIADRLARLLRDTFAEPPLALWVRGGSRCLGWGGLLLVGGSAEALSAVRARALADADIAPRVLPADVFAFRTPPTTDDWPYLYLPRAVVPRYHIVVAVAALAVAAVFLRRVRAPGAGVDATMVLLGAGFMLLEVSGVSRAALLFGTTWTVNAYVVGAILGMILVANLAASRMRVSPSGWPFAGLLASLLALALVPAAVFTALPLPARILVGGGFLALPVFFSGLVFVTAWSAEERRDLALGSNLIGSLVGGVASMLTMVVGFRGLTFLTLAVYLAALLTLRARGRTILTEKYSFG